ncbi:unnamed protein product [Brassica oleracea]
MSLAMLLIDEHSTLVQGSVPASLQLTFRGRLTEGSVYTLSGFETLGRCQIDELCQTVSRMIIEQTESDSEEECLLLHLVLDTSCDGTIRQMVNAMVGSGR